MRISDILEIISVHADKAGNWMCSVTINQNKPLEVQAMLHAPGICKKSIDRKLFSLKFLLLISMFH